MIAHLLLSLVLHCGNARAGARAASPGNAQSKGIWEDAFPQSSSGSGDTELFMIASGLELGSAGRFLGPVHTSQSALLEVAEAKLRENPNSQELKSKLRTRRLLYRLNLAYGLYLLGDGGARLSAAMAGKKPGYIPAINLSRSVIKHLVKPDAKPAEAAPSMEPN